MALQATLFHRGRPEESKEMLVHNLSESGALVEVDEDLQLGSPVVLQLNVGREAVRVSGEIVRIQSQLSLDTKAAVWDNGPDSAGNLSGMAVCFDEGQSQVKQLLKLMITLGELDVGLNE